MLEMLSESFREIVAIPKLCLPGWGPSSQRHCGTCRRRVAVCLPGCMRWVGMFGRVTPCWSTGAVFSGAADSE